MDVPASTPVTPAYTFPVRENKRPFPVENRPLDGHLQDFHALSSYLCQWQPNEFLDAISDFHLLVYLSRMDMLPIKDTMPELLEAIRQRDVDAVNLWKTQEVWRTLETLIAASSSSGPGGFHSMGHNDDAMMGGGGAGSSSSGGNGHPGTSSGGGGSGGGGSSNSSEATWTCNHCTFINPGDMQNCDMCSLPR